MNCGLEPSVSTKSDDDCRSFTRFMLGPGPTVVIPAEVKFGEAAKEMGRS